MLNLKFNKMKKLFINITLLITFGFFFYGCDSPAPTELVIDPNVITEDQVDVEIITKDTQDEFYSNGFDSTGVAHRLHKFGSVIVVTGTKISDRRTTIKFSLAIAAFFDRSKPVHNTRGDVVGFRTILPGVVKFNGIKAKIRQLKIKYKNGNVKVDTTLGSMYVVFSGRSNSVDPFGYNFQSRINFQLIPVAGAATSFPIPTPGEITGKVIFNGHRADKSLKAILEWNKSNGQKIEIVLGAVLKGSKVSFPLYSLKTRDDGRLVVPSQLLNTIPFERFDKIIFTFIRRLEFDNGSGSNRLKVLSQSIHTIIIDIP